MYVYARIIFLSLIDVLFCFSQAGPSHPSNRVRLLVRSIPTCCWDGLVAAVVDIIVLIILYVYMCVCMYAINMC